MNVTFKSPLVVEVIAGGEFELRKPLDVEISEENRVRYLSVPEGFVTDFESIPRLLGPLYALLKGRARRAAVLHDWLYWTRENRKWADDVFLVAMAQETNAVYRYSMWAAVRLFGEAYYKVRDCSKCEARNEDTVPGDFGG